MLGIRVNSFNETNVGEPEQDANSALTELDKGLRSGRFGEQCESIVRFPRLFEKYPFPILINSSFLKLADVFRVGNNFLRLWVLRVCQQSEKHLDKILNVDEFVRRVYSVIHSNDPIARALSLRTLGSMAGIIPERQQVHHSIRRSLDSHDSVEVEAAIHAANQFAAQSKTFAVSMCNKISDMIQGLATPAQMKLQLIPILQHMHHDTTTAAMVRQLCTDLLPKYPAEDFVLVTLDTLVHLASATLVDIPQQVDLLLDHLVKDPRWGVQSAALSGLQRLAKQAPHLWTADSVNQLVRVTCTSHQQKLLLRALDVCILLTKSPAICHAHIHLDSSNTVLDNQYTTLTPPLLSMETHPPQYLRHLATSYSENLPVSDVSEWIDTVESLFLVTGTTKNVNQGVLQSCLQCAVSLCQAHPPLSHRFIDLIATRLVENTDSSSTLLCEALGAIGGLAIGALRYFLPDIRKKLWDLANSNDASQTHTKVMLCTLVFQTMAAGECSKETQETVDAIVAKTNLWSNYRIARSAARYGQFGVVARIISQLEERVSSEHLHFWLVTLHELSYAEAALNTVGPRRGLLDRLGLAITHYCKTLAAIKAASTAGQTMVFQAEYTRLRCELLQCYAQLVAACNSLCTAPPPAIAAAIVQTTRDDLQRYGHITNQLRKSAKDFRACGDLYWKLYQSAFDADPVSLTNIQILQHTCMLMAYSIERVALPSHQGDEPSLDAGLQGGSIETQLMVQCCKQVSAMIRSSDSSVKPITHQHIESLLKQTDILTRGVFCLPRYLFQVRQSTSVKLAISPQPRVNGEWITVQSGSQLAVKVEGVIQHGSRPGLFRSITGVIVTLSSQLTARPNHDTKGGSDNGVVLTQTVTPHRDFFTGQFLVNMGCGGQHTVSVEASVVDQEGNVWHTGPKATIAVKAHEEAGARARTNL